MAGEQGEKLLKGDLQAVKIRKDLFNLRAQWRKVDDDVCYLLDQAFHVWDNAYMNLSWLDRLSIELKCRDIRRHLRICQRIASDDVAEIGRLILDLDAVVDRADKEFDAWLREEDPVEIQRGSTDTAE